MRRYLATTPVVKAPQLGPNVSVKVESFQPTGSFKVRGGLAAVAAALATDPGREMVGASAGNHGLGLAFAAARLKDTGHGDRAPVGLGGQGVRSPAVRRATGPPWGGLQRGGGARARPGGPGRSPLRLALQRSRCHLRSGDDRSGTAEQVPNLGTVVVPVGGGGLVSGISLGLSGADVRVIGVESEASPSMSAAVAAGTIVPITVEPTLADGLAGNLEPGAVTVDILVRGGVEIMTVSEADIRSAMVYAAPRWGWCWKEPARSAWRPSGRDVSIPMKTAARPSSYSPGATSPRALGRGAPFLIGATSRPTRRA